MRILTFTLLFSLITATSLFADVREWNISSDAFNTLGDITETTTIDGLTIYASADKKVTVDDNNKSIDGMDFTSRLKLGGSGSLDGNTPVARVVGFDVSGNSTITIAAMSSSSSSDRELVILTAEGDTIDIFPALGESISLLSYEYTGGPTSIYLFSKSSGINIYYLKVETEVSVQTKEQEWNISTDAFNALGDITETAVVEGLTIYANADKKVTVDENNKSVEGMDFTHRLKLGGSGSMEDGVPVARVVGFDVPGNTTITIAAMSSSSSSDRELVILTAEGDTIDIFPALGESISMASYEYTGAATSIYLFSKSSGINIYYIKAVSTVAEEGDPLVIFDPETAVAESLPDGMSIVDIEGKKYLQIVLAGWQSSFALDAPFELGEEVTHFTAEAKYAVGTSGFELNKINTFMKLVDNSTDGWVELGVDAAGSSSTFKMYKMPTKAAGTVTHMQVAGQETVSWSAVSGDTLWIGQVKAFIEVPVDPNVIVDPATFEGDLASGWEIVELDGSKYFKVTLNAWDSWMNVPEYAFPEGTTGFKANVKYEEGTSGKAVDAVNTFMKFSDPNWTELGSGAQAASADFVEQKIELTSTSGKARVFQVAAQEIEGGGAVTGGILYIGKVEVIFDNFGSNPTPVTFIVDDTADKTYSGFVLKGSWKNASGEYDSEWDGGVAQASFYDDGTNGDQTAGDHIWSVTVDLISDGGTNTWKWGFEDLDGNWMPTADIEFTVADENAVSTSYTIPKMPEEKAVVTFIIDDSAGKTYNGFMLKGSWKGATGVYDADWDGGVEHTAFYDDGTNGDETAGDNIWSVSLEMVPDGGANTWEWGFNDSEGNWIPESNIQFNVEDTTPVTTSYTTVGFDDYRNSLRLYPNPVNNLLNIAGVEIETVEVFNLSGARMLVNQNSASTIDVSNLNKGAYLIKVTSTNGQTLINKFNKQ